MATLSFYEEIVFRLCIILFEKKIGYCVMVKRKLQNIFWRFCPFTLLDYIKGRNNYFFVDILQIGWGLYICLSIFLWIFLFMFL